MTKAAAQKSLANEIGYRTATKVAVTALIYVGLRGCCLVGWEYISTGRWWATLMRHHLLACPPLPLALGVGMTALAAGLVALAGSTLGATSGLARTSGAAIALTTVAVAADEYSSTAAGAQKEPGRRLGSWHGQSSPCVKPASGQPRTLREILCAQRCSPVGPRGAAVGLTWRLLPLSRLLLTQARRFVAQKSSAVPYLCAGSLPPPHSKAGSPRTHPCPTERALQFDSKEVQRSRRLSG